MVSGSAVPSGLPRYAALYPALKVLLITHKSWAGELVRPAFVSESQRDSVPQPMVARYALPWEIAPSNDQPQRGCVLLLQSHFKFHAARSSPCAPYFTTKHGFFQDTTPLGLEC